MQFYGIVWPCLNSLRLSSVSNGGDRRLEGCQDDYPFCVLALPWFRPRGSARHRSRGRCGASSRSGAVGRHPDGCPDRRRSGARRRHTENPRSQAGFLHPVSRPPHAGFADTGVRVPSTTTSRDGLSQGSRRFPDATPQCDPWLWPQARCPELAAGLWSAEVQSRFRPRSPSSAAHLWRSDRTSPTSRRVICSN